ncbi:hypothetical protein [Hymenobacter rigui]|uniref:Uncharacterized protein n=1 Tax=Hymenobacter rigui TaxID=334424 RepID=A0A428KFF8_9BACT|nr:hypothetical protein [Hymenobacter rigui]RSK45191.1 hypothetical protein EI291_18950 [Hymenobacter rigui]
MANLQPCVATRAAFRAAAGSSAFQPVTWISRNNTTGDTSGTVTATGSFAAAVANRKVALPATAKLRFGHNTIFDYGGCGWFNDYPAFNTLCYGFYLDSAATWQVWLNGSGSGLPGGAWLETDVLQVEIYPDRVVWLVNGGEVYALPTAPAEAELWPGAVLYYAQAAFTNAQISGDALLPYA